MLVINGKAAVRVYGFVDDPGFHMGMFLIEDGGLVYFFMYLDFTEANDYLDDIAGILDTFTIQGTYLDPRLVGEWSLVSTDDPEAIQDMEDGWEFKTLFNADGTAVEMWYIPDTGWHEVVRYTWTTSGELLIYTLVEFDFDIISEHYEEEFAEALQDFLGMVMLAYSFSIENGDLTTVDVESGTFYISRRN